MMTRPSMHPTEARPFQSGLKPYALRWPLESVLQAWSRLTGLVVFESGRERAACCSGLVDSRLTTVCYAWSPLMRVAIRTERQPKKQGLELPTHQVQRQIAMG
uniref:Uncharacterized protein n=1 Tax=mine drainage metagenome TaxID=410659 RepID=E6QMY2_9ZZZZ